uniref:Serum amyloid A protein n=1 Tax=Chelonoidis abingdonii TaxID=106734 RepID=A0A8C0GW76_CHEAB
MKSEFLFSHCTLSLKILTNLSPVTSVYITLEIDRYIAANPWNRHSKNALNGFSAGDMLHAYSDMREANYKNSDKYFHAPKVISDAREGWQGGISGRGAEDTHQDQEANEWGRSGKDPNHYRPKGLPSKY